jgi:hypothetical protein
MMRIESKLSPDRETSLGMAEDMVALANFLKER